MPEIGAIIAADIVADYTKAQAEIKKAEKDIKELGETADKTSDQIDETADSMDDLGDSSKKTNTEIDKNKVNLASQMIALEGVTSALNQTTGGLNKMIGGLEASNIVNEEQARTLQNNVRQIELVTGGLEVLIAIKKLDTVVTAAMTGMNFKAAISNFTLAGSISAVSAAMWANPIMTIVAGAILLTGVLLLLEKEFGTVTAGIEAANAAFEKLAGSIQWAREQLADLKDGMAEWGGDQLDAFNSFISGDFISGGTVV
jgi:cell division protein FtsB